MFNFIIVLAFMKDKIKNKLRQQNLIVKKISLKCIIAMP